METFSTATTTDTIKHAAGRSRRIKENKSSWCLKAWNLPFAAFHAAVVTLKYTMELMQMDPTPQECAVISKEM